MQKTTKYKLTVKEQREITLSLIHKIKPSRLQLHELSIDTVIKFYGMYKLINSWQTKIAIRNGIPLQLVNAIKTRNDVPWFNETVTTLIKEAKELNSVKEENIVKDTPPVYKPTTNTSLNQEDVDRISNAVVIKIMPQLLEAIANLKSGIIPTHETKLYGTAHSIHTHACSKEGITTAVIENPIPIPDPITRNPKPAIKTRLPRILVYGLFKPQQEIVGKNWKDKFDLHFIDFKRNGINKMELDYCIGMTKFMNHSVDGSLKKLYSDCYIRITGAVSELQKQLNDLYSKIKAH